MEKQFIPYELALKLKELGFNEPVLACYTQNAYGSHVKKLNYFVEFIERVNEDNVFVSAPLWQQAFDWFRFEHGHYCNIVPNPTSYIKHKNKEWLFGYNIINGVNPMFDLRYKTYEEARLSCLEKLIELVELKKDSV